jgi:hypothetical protein
MRGPAVVYELPAPVAERDLRRTLTEAASRVGIAVGILAIVAFAFIALVVSKSQKGDAGELLNFKKSGFSEPASDHLTLEPVERLNRRKCHKTKPKILLERLKQWQPGRNDKLRRCDCCLSKHPPTTFKSGADCSTVNYFTL